MPPRYRDSQTNESIWSALGPYFIVFFIGVCFVLFGYARSKKIGQPGPPGLTSSYFQGRNIRSSKQRNSRNIRIIQQNISNSINRNGESSECSFHPPCFTLFFFLIDASQALSFVFQSNMLIRSDQDKTLLLEPTSSL